MKPIIILIPVILTFLVPFTEGQESSQHHPKVPFMDQLVLVEEIDCSQEDHDFRTNGVTEVRTILGKECRVLIPSASSNYFSYRLGMGMNLQAGKAYFLEIEYPDDTDRNFVVQNRGGEYTRGIQTGKTIGDMYQPLYVQSNPESVSFPHSMQYIKWQTLFWLHDYYAGLELPRNVGSRPEKPENGFLVIICQFDSRNNPFNNGAAISAIRLYEAPDFQTLKQDINYPPGELPRRHLFFREEMADGVVDNSPPAVVHPADFYEHEAQLMQFLGMNTFSKDLLEFGHNQGWDPGPYAALVNTPAWKDRWENIINMLTKYDMYVLPYYEYAGTIGPQGLGPQQRAHPLNDNLPNHDYTHISWVEDVNADITEPATYDDLKKIFERTIVLFKDKVNFIGAWLRPRPSEIPVSFADAALNRFRTEANGGIGISRGQLKNDQQLYNRYIAWWMGKRKDFLLAMRDYLREEGDIEDAVILYTTDYSEPGKTHYDWGYEHNVLTDDIPSWQELAYTYPLFDLDEYIARDWHLEAQLLPENTWGDWEWAHSVPLPDPDNYSGTDGVLLTYTFNKAYTVGSINAFDRFRSTSGLAIIRHYCLNESGMQGMGYFVSDIEWHDSYTMLTEARAMANGDPRYIGYLASSAFNRGSIAYVREFNANFLALPALPSVLLEDATDDDGIAVREIKTDQYGTYLAVINTGLEDKYGVTVILPDQGDVAEAINGRMILANASEIILDMYPGQLKSLVIYPPTGKKTQTISIESIPVKNSDDEPFKLKATASSGLELSWLFKSGPALLDGDLVTITGEGWINLEVVQAGNEQYYPATEKITIRVDPADASDLANIHEDMPVHFYPNPSGKMIYIELMHPVNFIIYDTTGCKVIEMKLDHSQPVNISSLSTGIYFVEFSDKTHRSVSKMIKSQ